MKFSFASLLISAALVCTSVMPASADDKQLSKEEVEAIVKKVIQDNPELIFKSLSDYQTKSEMEHASKMAQKLAKIHDKLAKDTSSPSIGNPKADVTVLEFFDYHCGYCKRFFPEITSLIKEDKNVRFILKEFPILSEDSITAARAALAVYAIAPAKYFDYHVALMNTNGKFSEELLTDKAKDLGIDPEAFKKAFEDPARQKEVDANKELAHSLGISATPTLIIGPELVPGAIPFDDLKGKVTEVRNNQKQGEMRSE